MINNNFTKIYKNKYYSYTELEIVINIDSPVLIIFHFLKYRPEVTLQLLKNIFNMRGIFNGIVTLARLNFQVLLH